MLRFMTFFLMITVAAFTLTSAPSPYNNYYSQDPTRVSYSYIVEVGKALKIDFSKYDQLTSEETKVKNNGRQKKYDRFRLVYSPDRKKAVEYYTDASGAENILRQVWTNGKVEMFGTKNGKKYWYMFHNPSTGNVLFCYRSTPISEKDIIKGNALNGSAKNCADIYYQYKGDGNDLIGIVGSNLFGSSILLTEKPMSAAYSVSPHSDIHTVRSSDLALSVKTVPSELRESYSKLFTKTYQQNIINLAVSVPQLPEIMPISDRIRKENAEKQKQEQLAKEKAEKKAREDDMAYYIKKNGVTKEFLRYYTSNNHCIEAKSIENGMYDIFYYYIGNDGHLIKASFSLTNSSLKEDVWQFLKKDMSKHNLNTEVYLSDSEIKKYYNCEITDVDTGVIIYSAAEEENKKYEQRRKEAAAEKAAKEKEERLKRQKLAKKYGAKYVDAALSGKLMIGMPLELVIETSEWFSVSLDSENSYTSYYDVTRHEPTYLGRFPVRYAHIGVSNGKISYIRYVKR